MKYQVLFCSVATAAIMALPAYAAPGDGMFGVRWGKNAFNFEGMTTGPQPLRNLSRQPNGKANAGRLVGDYNNPILTPYGVGVVKQKGELAAAGKGFPNSQDQCRPEAPPFAMAMTLDLTMLPTKAGDIAIWSGQHDEVRHIRMNGTHPAKLAPTPLGHSVGHWEGETLVIDTVGIAVNPYTSVDRFGTPQSEQMHVIERYRLLDYEDAKEGLERDAKENQRPPVGIDRNYRGKHLQLRFTVEDPDVFTMPWTATIIYPPGLTARRRCLRREPRR